MKKTIITGITGQDGSYLAELLLAKGYEAHGIVRRASTFNRSRIEHIKDFDLEDHGRLILHYGDLVDMASLLAIFSEVRPDEIYNLAAQSHVQVSFETPQYTSQVDALGVLNVLEAARVLKLPAKIYQASTSELYSGDPAETPQNELTPFKPRSPYGVAKLYGFHIARIYRESYGMFISNGILFNHEGERRGESFVTRKITQGIREIALGKRDAIHLGNLDAKRDWGYAKEYVEAMYLMLQQPEPDDYIVATGVQHSVREFCEEAFKEAGVTIHWEGKGLDEKGINAEGRTLVGIDPKFYRPNEVRSLVGNSSKTQKVLRWKPKTDFKELVRIMMRHDLAGVPEEKIKALAGPGRPPRPAGAESPARTKRK
ncbi:GDP-mannose 4,6-dehydratase [Patescibacteria group bacterium]|nr:GDP-mannose 4,6-dehydratase [Patescibacteria group bacterium]